MKPFHFVSYSISVAGFQDLSSCWMSWQLCDNFFGSVDLTHFADEVEDQVQQHKAIFSDDFLNANPAVGNHFTANFYCVQCQ